MTDKEFKRVKAILKEYETLQENANLLKQFLAEADDHSENGVFIIKFQRPYTNEMGVLTREINLNRYDHSIIEKVMEVLKSEFSAMGEKMAKLTAYEEKEK